MLLLGSLVHTMHISYWPLRLLHKLPWNHVGVLEALLLIVSRRRHRVMILMNLPIHWLIVRLIIEMLVTIKSLLGCLRILPLILMGT
jgi:hypothetical protein